MDSWSGVLYPLVCFLRGPSLQASRETEYSLTLRLEHRTEMAAELSPLGDASRWAKRSLFLELVPSDNGAGNRRLKMPLPEFSLQDVLQLAEILSILSGGGLVAFKLGRTTTSVEMTLKQQNDVLMLQSKEISELKTETKRLGDVLTAIAVQQTRLERLEQDIQEMKHGRGFVNPM